jgi:hypothetical protein
MNDKEEIIIEHPGITFKEVMEGILIEIEQMEEKEDLEIIMNKKKHIHDIKIIRKRKRKYTKKVENKECPYRDTIIILGSGKPIYWCALFRDKKQCIFKGHPHDAGECSYYLFPIETVMSKKKHMEEISKK